MTGRWGLPALPSPVTGRAFTARDDTMAAARVWTGDQAAERGWGQVRDVVELMVSELATNVLQHTDSQQLVVRIDAKDDLEVAVYDSSRTKPVVRRPASPWDETGRGLVLVECLADDWGCRPLPDGKWVWFRLRRRP